MRVFHSPALFCVCLALISGAVLPAMASEPPASDSLAVSAKDKGAHTLLTLQGKDGHKYKLSLQRDHDVAVRNALIGVELAKALDDETVAVIDTYNSLPGGAHYCQAGEERFLRVISLAHKPAQVMWSLKIASCRQNLELAEPGLVWHDGPASLTIVWLSGPSAPGKSESRSYAIAADGKVTQE